MTIHPYSTYVKACSDNQAFKGFGSYDSPELKPLCPNISLLPSFPALEKEKKSSFPLRIWLTFCVIVLLSFYIMTKDY